MSGSTTTERGSPSPDPALRLIAAVIAVITVIAVAPAAVVQAQVATPADYLARMDRDGDGRVSPAEYQDWLGYAFDAMDSNRDGVLAAAELPGGRGQPVTRAEHRARLATAFNRQDGNRDGFLDAKELAAPPQ